MFLGHFGLAYAAKRIAPQTSLGLLFAAAQLADLAWPILLMAGIEYAQIEPGATVVTPIRFLDYPYSHGLLSLVVAGVVLGAALVALGRSRFEAFVVGALVPSHWILDWVVHVADLPLYPTGADRFGLGAWQSLAGTLLVEAVTFGAGFLIYLRCTQAVSRTGRYATFALAAFLAVAYIANVFGPPPKDLRTLEYAGIIMWLIVPWATWSDANRRVR
jgi:hypothetical protein